MVMALTWLPGRWRGGAGAERISCSSCAEEQTTAKERERERKKDTRPRFSLRGILREMVGMRQYEKKDKWLFVTLSQSLSNSKHGCASQISMVIIKAE